MRTTNGRSIWIPLKAENLNYFCNNLGPHTSQQKKVITGPAMHLIIGHCNLLYFHSFNPYLNYFKIGPNFS